MEKCRAGLIRTDDELLEQVVARIRELSGQDIFTVSDDSLLTQISAKVAPFIATSLKIEYVWMGTGQRFIQTWQAIRHELVDKQTNRPKVSLFYSPVLGTDDSVVINEQGKLVTMTSLGIEIPEFQYFGLNKAKSFSAWGFMRQIRSKSPGNRLIITGAQFLDMLDYKERGTTSSMFKADFKKEKITKIMEDGKLLDYIFARNET